MTSVVLVMIARDEERCIGRALSSASAFVDELIVLDTGSTDSTVDIARACGARVQRFEWRDDFAAARNAALALSSASYNFILDADEWVESGGLASASGAKIPQRPWVGLRGVMCSALRH